MKEKLSVRADPRPSRQTIVVSALARQGTKKVQRRYEIPRQALIDWPEVIENLAHQFYTALQKEGFYF